MIALTLHQPYATASALELKPWETRGYQFHRLGELVAVHAGHGVDAELLRWGPLRQALRRAGEDPNELPAGAVVAIMRVDRCLPILPASPQLPGLGEHLDPSSLSTVARRLGDFAPGRFAWGWSLVRRLEQPLVIPGMPGQWNIDDRLMELAT